MRWLHPARRGRLLAEVPWLGVLAAVYALGLVVYRPWLRRPIGIADFSAYVPMLRGGGDFLGALLEISRFYLAEHGRLNLLSYAGIALKWSVLGEVPERWYWLRCAQMAVIVIAAYALLRRLGIHQLGAVCGASLFIVSGTAWQGWTTLSVGEPLGLLCFLVAGHAALGFRAGRRTVPRAAVIVGGAVAGLLAKEMLVFLVPWLYLLAGGFRASQDDGSRRATRRLAGALVVAVAVVGAAVLRARAGAPSTAYVAPYGAGEITLPAFAHRFVIVLMPMAGALRGGGLSRLVCDAVTAGLLWSGWRLLLRAPATAVAARHDLGAALSVITLGVLVYLPWPGFFAAYAFPMLIGPAVMLGWAVTALWTRGRWRWAVGATVAALVTWWTGAASRYAGAEVHAAIVEDRLVDVVAAARGDSLRYATRAYRPVGWGSAAGTLQAYGRIVRGVKLPDGRDVGCDAAWPAPAVGQVVVVSHVGDCDPPAHPHEVVRETYLYLDWPVPRLARDSVSAWVALSGEELPHRR